MEKKRIFYLDFIKFIAIYAVIINHVHVYKFNNLDIYTENIFFFIRNHLITIHIPLFLMISGVVTLSKTIELKKIIKLVLRIIVFCVIFQVIYMLLYTIYKHGTIDILEWLKTIYSGYIFSIIWYFPKFYIPFLLLLPILHIVAINFNEKSFMFYTFLFFVFKIIIKILENSIKLNPNIVDMSSCIYDPFYLPLLSYWIHNTSRFFNKKYTLIYILIAIISIFFREYIMAINAYNYFLCFSLFALFKIYNAELENIHKFIKMYITNIGKNSIFIYMLHYFVWLCIIKICDKINFSFHFSEPFSCFILSLVVLVVTNFITNIKKRIYFKIVNSKNSI